MTKQEQRAQNPLYTLLGAFFTIAVLISSIVLITNHAKAASNTPVVDKHIIVSPTEVGADITQITLTEGADTQIFIRGTVSDQDGSADITKVMIAFYASGDGVTSNCVNDSSDVCYKTEILAVDLDCVGQINPETCSYLAKLYLTYHTSSTTFTVAVSALDTQNNVSAIASSDAKTVKSLRAIDIPTFLDYGTLNVGQSASAVLTVTNMGNVTTNVKVRSENLTCDGTGIIWATLLTFDGVSLSNSDVDIPNYNLVKQIGNTPSTRNSQMSITSVPAAEGICAGNLTMTAY